MRSTAARSGGNKTRGINLLKRDVLLISLLSPVIARDARLFRVDECVRRLCFQREGKKNIYMSEMNAAFHAF